MNTLLYRQHKKILYRAYFFMTGWGLFWVISGLSLLLKTELTNIGI